MNKVVGVVALFGAFGIVALAVALTPGAQTPASSATAPQEDFRISRIDVPPAPEPAPVAAASLNTTIVVVQPPPQPAPKADRLFRTSRTPEDRNGQPPAAPGASDTHEPGERDVAMADMPDTPDTPEPTAAREAAESAGRKLDEDSGRSLEFGLSEPPVPGDIGDAAAEEAAAEDGDAEVVESAAEEDIDAADAAVEDIAAVAEEAVEEAATEVEAVPEVAATRTAAVTTDVNMRARPSNGAAVISVVPRKSTVEVIGCNYWCEVMYEGRRGFIYKGFVRGS